MDRDFAGIAPPDSPNRTPCRSKKVSLPRDVKASVTEAATPSSLAASLPEVFAVEAFAMGQLHVILSGFIFAPADVSMV